MIFVDEASLVSACRWCWRQSAQSAAGPETVAALITIEGQHDDAAGDVGRATEDFLHLLAVHQSQAIATHTLLSPDSPRFDPATG